MADELSRQIAALGDDDGLRAILVEVCRLTGMHFAAIAYVSEDRWIVTQVEDDLDFGLSPGEELEIRKTICDEVRRYAREILIDDTTADPDWWNHPVPLLYGFRSYLSVPIEIEGHFFGTLCAIDPEPREAPLLGLAQRLGELAAESGRLLTRQLAQQPLARAAIPLRGQVADPR